MQLQRMQFGATPCFIVMYVSTPQIVADEGFWLLQAVARKYVVQQACDVRVASSMHGIKSVKDPLQLTV